MQIFVHLRRIVADLKVRPTRGMRTALADLKVRPTEILATQILAVAAIVVLASAAVSTQSPRFFRDDPIAREPDPEDASGAQPSDVGLTYDLSYNLFVTADRAASGKRAGNINTIDEVPDSSWFTNRLGVVPMSVDDVVRGPNTGPPP